MDIRLLGSIFRLRRIAWEFGHYWSYGVEPEKLAELFGNSASFAEFQKKLRELCIETNTSPVGGRYLEDASFEEGWLTAFFGGDNQLRVSLNPDQKLIRAEYVNGSRRTSAVYNNSDGELFWETPLPTTPRDAVRVLKVIAVLAECNPKLFVNAHLPSELNNEEARLYTNLPSWSHLWVSPAVLEDVLPR